MVFFQEDFLCFTALLLLLNAASQLINQERTFTEATSLLGGRNLLCLVQEGLKSAGLEVGRSPVGLFALSEGQPRAAAA